jgi:hypothetical protein
VTGSPFAASMEVQVGSLMPQIDVGVAKTYTLPLDLVSATQPLWRSEVLVLVRLCHPPWLKRPPRVRFLKMLQQHRPALVS